MKVIAFDLDDTLVKEREFCISGFRAVSEILKDRLDPEEVEAVMTDALIKRRNHYEALEAFASERGVSLDMPAVVDTCRNHKPDFREESASRAREWIGTVLRQGNIPAIITDGRTVTQRNKLEGLGILDMIDSENILISSEQGADKKSDLMFRRLMERHPEADGFVYVGDNVEKDFLWPGRLGWKTVGVRDQEGINIHPQDLNAVSDDNMPDEWV